MLEHEYEMLLEAYDSIKELIPYRPRVGVVLGSGLGKVAEKMTIDASIGYGEIAHFPKSTVEGHKGNFIFAHSKTGVPIVFMQGRVHYYEGYDMAQVVMPARLMKLMGAEVLLLTNAAGGANADFNPGDLMIIKDQISTFVPSPLRGHNISEFGTRFPDMSCIYDKDLIELIKKCAASLQIYMKEGIYIQLSGPQYETPAEVQLCIRLGADAIGMSTACEAVAARHMGMKVAGISLITNKACGLSQQVLSHEEVQKTADLASEQFSALVLELINHI